MSDTRWLTSAPQASFVIYHQSNRGSWITQNCLFLFSSRINFVRRDFKRGNIVCIETPETHRGFSWPVKWKIPDESGAFRKCFSNRTNLKTPALRSSLDRKHFESGSFKTMLFLGHKFKVSGDCCNGCWNSSGVLWTENIWCVFILSETSVFNFHRRTVDGT